MSELTIIKREDNGNLIIFTRSDGMTFNLNLNVGEEGHASLFHVARPTFGHGIGLDMNITDKIAAAEKWILAYPVGWPTLPPA